MAIQRTFSIIKPNAVKKMLSVQFITVLKVQVLASLVLKCCI